jgi:carbonic anhydrase
MKFNFNSKRLQQNRNEKSKIALQRLIDGNERFASGVRTVEHQPTPSKLKELSQNGQNPFCIILSCADSRVPSEMVFDLGLGDLFVIRVAGNVIAPSLLASIEFAASNFGSPLLMVMGHSKCGAIKATIDSVKNNTQAPSKNLEDLIGRIKPAVVDNIPKVKNHEDLVDACTWENVFNTLKTIHHESTIVQKLVRNHKLMLVGSVFDLDSGKVTFNNSQQAILWRKIA